MPYTLGIDVGTVSTTVAVSRLRHGTWSDAELVPVGDKAGPGYVRRIGDDVPLVLGGEPYRASELTGELVSHIVGRVDREEGGPPEQIVFAVPGTWGAYRRGLLHEALWRIGIEDVTVLAQPIAAAEWYAAGEPVDVGGVLAVYALGATHCECAVVRRTSAATFELLACMETGEPVGGADFDDLLVERVRAELGPDFDADPVARRVLAGLRQRCAAAKEELSRAAEVTIRLPLDGAPEVTVTRDEFEELIHPLVDSTMRTLQRTVRAAGVEPADLDALVLVGRAVRVPLVRRMADAAAPGRVAVEPDGVAKGAAHAARTMVAQPGSVAAYRPATVADDHDEDLPRPPRPPVVITELEAPRRRSARRTAWEMAPGARLTALGLAVLVIVVGIWLTLASGFGHGSWYGM
ncbi:MAG: hypothetical protein AUI14_24040 [Actinobacteria bacterium 13_2_20CM_2_71_6]|nr:MAG: hypothetical protein AUI14_24040 [Actinobacteria bacterium 13_2_20CM_2_71_6]